VIDAAVNLALAATNLIAETWNGTSAVHLSHLDLNNDINYKSTPFEQLLRYRVPVEKLALRPKPPIFGG